MNLFIEDEVDNFSSAGYKNTNNANYDMVNISINLQINLYLYLQAGFILKNLEKKNCWNRKNDRI